MDDNKVELLAPSIVHTKKINPKVKLSFVIDMKVWKSSATILLTTHLLDIQAAIKKDLGSDSNIEILDSSNFGMKIDNAKLFKKKYCQKKSCKLFL